MLKPALQNSVNFCTFRRRKTAIGQHSYGVFDLRRFAGANQYRGNVIVTQHPGERHLRQFLAPSRSQFIQLANFFQFVGGNLFWFKETASARRAGIFRNAIQITVSELPARQRREGNTTDAFPATAPAARSLPNAQKANI